jgi:tungstate transport system permease protein
VGAFLALSQFPGRSSVVVLVNALMGLPPVIVGLAVFLLLSRSGPLGSFGLLFTPRAMVLAQALLVTPIIVASARQTIQDLWSESRDELTMGVGAVLLWSARFSLITALLAGFGRASAEVGALMIVAATKRGLPVP